MGSATPSAHSWFDDIHALIASSRFVLSWVRLGPAFTFKSFGAIALVFACTMLAPKVVRFELLNPWVASVLGGFLIGFGLFALLRHQASVGGVNILALNHRPGRYSDSLAPWRDESCGRCAACAQTDSS